MYDYVSMETSLKLGITDNTRKTSHKSVHCGDEILKRPKDFQCFLVRRIWFGMSLCFTALDILQGASKLGMWGVDMSQQTIDSAWLGGVQQAGS